MPRSLDDRKNAPRIVRTPVSTISGSAAREFVPDTAPDFDMAFVYSTERLASDGGVIKVDGWRFEDYLTNPRFLASHDISGQNSPTLIEQIVGSSVWVGTRDDIPARYTFNGKALIGAVRFAPTDFGRDVALLYSEGHLDATSVRWDWRTEIMREPFEEEVRFYGDDLWWVTTRADLVEVSAVVLGADPGALAIRSMMDGGTPDIVLRDGHNVRIDACAKRAYARCRQAGHELPAFERLLNQFEMPVEIKRDPQTTLTLHADGNGRASATLSGTGIIMPPEPSSDLIGWSFPETVRALQIEHERHTIEAPALADAMNAVDDAVDMMNVWLDSGVKIHAAIEDAIQSIKNLMVENTPEAFAGDDDDEERDIDMRQEDYDALLAGMARNTAMIEAVMSELGIPAPTLSDGEAVEPEEAVTPEPEEAEEPDAENGEAETEAEEAAAAEKEDDVADEGVSVEAKTEQDVVEAAGTGGEPVSETVDEEGEDDFEVDLSFLGSGVGEDSAGDTAEAAVATA